MPSTKVFLLQECKNVSVVLAETLRNRYGHEGSREFYEECRVRLDFLTNEIETCLDADTQALMGFSGLLNELSKLIWRIERSSLGEYSWPFVDELKRLAASVCSEATLTDPVGVPLIHVMANGGLDAYAIFPERRRPSGAQKRILTIVFPQSLKHFVLLHSILGHEIGHAMFACSQQQQQLVGIVNGSLCATGSVFHTADSTSAWLFSKDAPSEIQAQLAKLPGVSETDFFLKCANWRAWLEELLCDLIGVLTFGPSFIAAECHLLYALDPSGLLLGPNHPPVAVRANLMLRYAHAMDFDNAKTGDTAFQGAVFNFWKDLDEYRVKTPWFDAFSDAPMSAALSGIAAFLSSHALASYTKPTLEGLETLYSSIARCVPPVGFAILDRKIACERIDFRHVLYAGWIASKKGGDPDFPTINRLCEHAIMQQRAIDLQIS